MSIASIRVFSGGNLLNVNEININHSIKMFGFLVDLKVTGFYLDGLHLMEAK